MPRTCPHCGEKLYVSTRIMGAPSEKTIVRINVETAKTMLMKDIPLSEIANAFQVEEVELRETLKRFGVEP